MQTVFFICFGVGAGFTVISFLLGELLGHLDLGGADVGDADINFDVNPEMDIGPGFDPEIGGPDEVGTISPLKPSIIAAFLTVFGGVGLLLIRRFDWLFSVIGAGLLGLLAAYLIFRFIMVPLSKRQNTSAVEKQNLIGHNAAVSEAIPQGGFGKITYYANGNTYSAPARAESGGAIGRKATVEIVGIEKHTYFVREK